MPPLARLPLLILGFLGLFAGMGAGLARLGWGVPDIAASASAMHGPLMICAFFGVVISLERAVAVGLVPFIVATILKTVLAGLTLPIAWRCIERIRRATM